MRRGVLLTQSRLKNYAGSEVIIIELAEHFSAQGVPVTILTNYLDYPIKKDFLSLQNVKVVLTTTEEADRINIKDYELLWIHHSTLTPKLLGELISLDASLRPFIVFNHMSSVEPLEFPVMHNVEKTLADVVVFNSQETLEMIRAKGAVFPERQSMVIGNPAPDRFFGERRRMYTYKPYPRSIAIISNHVPDEVRNAAGLLRQKRMKVDIIGKEKGGSPIRVTPTLLKEYELVVSIGKTIQYCIVGNIPVYCYDRFGGPGFINERNFSANRKLNFSGRGNSRKSPQEIVKDILSGFSIAVKEHEALHNEYAQEFVLSTQLKLLNSHRKKSSSGKTLAKVDRSIYDAYLQIVNMAFPGYFKFLYQLQGLEASFLRVKKDIETERVRFTAHKARCEAELEATQSELQQTKKELDRLNRSRVMRLRSYIIKVVSWGKRFFSP